MEYLLLVHIGPVQDFIATARRSRDLWFGSWLLSELSKAAALAVVEQEEGQLERLIFPYPKDIAALQVDSSLNVANKIVALVKEPPSLEVEGDYIQQAIWRRLRDIRRQAYKFVSGNYDKEMAKVQVDDLPEYYWVAVPFDDNQYTAIREQAETLMTARKSTRDFRPVKWGGTIPKSSLDGVRESVIPEEAFPTREDNGQERQNKIEALFTDYGARPAERLSGVDLLKRHGYHGQVSGFPSTSHIASLPLRHRLKQAKNLKQLWEAYIQIFPQQILKQERVPPSFGDHPIFGNTDGSLLFESRLSEYLEGPILTEAKKKLHLFLQEASGGQEPLPYYALLMADGDGMGRVIDAQKTPGQHRNFSGALAGFAARVPEIINSFDGALVYAGGDDVLAFVPLHTALACAQKLAATFRQNMEGAQLKDEQGNSPTFSVGIAVSHHLEPLSDALTLARRAEHEVAKSVKGKNALAISVDMRSGEPRTVVGHWNEVDTRLRQLIEFHRQDAIPDGAAYQLRETVLRLGGDKVIGKDKTLQEVIKKEGKRILSRKRAHHGSSELAETVLKDLKKFVMDETLPIGQLADELMIARLFAQAEDQAFGPFNAQGGNE